MISLGTVRAARVREAEMVRIHNILCPVDFFPASEGAAMYAIALANKLGARLTLLHVVEPVVTWASEFPLDTTELVNEMTARSSEELKKLARRAKGAKIRVDVLLRTGEVDTQIQSLIPKRSIDFVVMGTHGRRGLEKFFMGSTTERLLRKLQVPLLTIRNIKSTAVPAGIRVRHILVTIDFSEGTTDSIAYAFAIAQQYHAKVTLLHVLNDIDADISGRYRDQLIRTIRRDLEELLPGDARKSRNVTVRVETGRPIRRILPMIRKEEIDLVVINIHGKTLLDRLSLGSTAEKLVRGSAAPVLVIPPMPTTKRRQRRSKRAA
jgi:nucleotide-binding universal stress UspA family protein